MTLSSPRNNLREDFPMPCSLKMAMAEGSAVSPQLHLGALLGRGCGSTGQLWCLNAVHQLQQCHQAWYHDKNMILEGETSAALYEATWLFNKMPLRWIAVLVGFLTTLILEMLLRSEQVTVLPPPGPRWGGGDLWSTCCWMLQWVNCSLPTRECVQARDLLKPTENLIATTTSLISVPTY